jgi:Na+/H+-translocating membrane pyrophosphatase
MKRIEFALKLQLGISTVLTLLILIPMVPWSLPNEWKFVNNGKQYTCNKWYAYLVTCIGLISGFLIGLSTDYYTSSSHAPVREMAESCKSGAAINIIYGLAVGYMSTIIPVLLLSMTIIVGIKLCGMFGMALGALGMLSTLCVGLAIDAYGPISDNAGGKSIFFK